MKQKLLDWLLKQLTKLPEREEHISRDALGYWLRRERQSKLDQKGWNENT